MAIRIGEDIDKVVQEMNESIPELEELHAQTMIPSDAAELAETQLLFLRDSLLGMKDKITGEISR